MTRIVSVSSAHGGTGKTSLAVNVGVVVVRRGLRVGIVDTAMQSPGLAAALALPTRRSLADYLRGDCDIGDTVHHLPCQTGGGEGALFVVPAVRGPHDAAGTLAGGYDPGVLVEGCRLFADLFDLDLLVLDTPPGLNTEAIVCVGLAQVNLHVDRVRSRPPLGLTPSLLVVNMVPVPLTEAEVLDQARRVHGNVPAMVLPYSPEFAAIHSGGIFVTSHPQHVVTHRIQTVAQLLTGRSVSEFMLPIQASQDSDTVY